jgi:hypothetical protein
MIRRKGDQLPKKKTLTSASAWVRAKKPRMISLFEGLKMSLPLFESARALAHAVWEDFLARRQIGRVQASKAYQMQKFTNAQPTKRRAVPLFGSDSGFGEDWASYRTPKTQGPGAQPLPPELKNIDADSNLERWVPDPSVPSLISHGRALNYQHQSDQRPVTHFSGETTAEAWDGVVRASEPRKSLETSRRAREKTIADKITEEWNKVEPYDFRA